MTQKNPEKPKAGPPLRGLAALQTLAAASQVAHDLAHALNTGTAGNEAPKATEKYLVADWEKTIAEAEAAGVESPREAAAFLRAKWPEPPRPRQDW